MDKVTDGLKPQLVADLGATYHHGSIAELGIEADVVIECTGAGQLVFDAMEHAGANGIVCLTGLSSGGRSLEIDAGVLNRRMVLENDVVFGSVNANRRHYTRRLHLDHWQEAYERRPGDVKTVLQFSG